jgi:hypothetical protein
MSILTNNRDRGEFKIRIHEGIIAQKINSKFHEESKRLDGQSPGIVPFGYFNKDGEHKTADACIKGSFYLGEVLVNPGSGAWCATKLDKDGNLKEWGYCIDLEYAIDSIEDAISVAEQLLERKKSVSYIIGYLKTYIVDRENRSAIFKSPELLEVLRNKSIFPPTEQYQIGDVITVRDQDYILDESLELGKYWRALAVVVKKKLVRKQKGEAAEAAEAATRKKTPSSSKERHYGTNKEQEGERNIRTYQGIVDEDYNRSKRGANRRETIKECVAEFDYMDRTNKRVRSKATCVDKDLTVDGVFIGPGGGRWCATEVDDTGLMREWGYCVKDGTVSATEKTEWDDLCAAIRYEQWEKISTISRRLLLAGHTEKTIFNNLIQFCDRKRMAPHFEQLKRIVNIQFIKLYPWVLVKLPKPNVELLKIKSSISTVIASKLEYLEKGIHVDLHTGLVGSADDLWLLNYYFIVERLIVHSMISDSEDFDLALLERVKKTKNLEALNEILVKLEMDIKRQIRKYIQDIDADSNVLVDLKSSHSDNGNSSNKSSSKSNSKQIDPNLVVVNYGAFFGTISSEQRQLYYSELDLTIPLALQLATYNKSFVEPKELSDIVVYEKRASSEKKRTSSPKGKKADWDDENVEFFSNYPEVIDPDFYVKLNKKKEFFINKMESWKGKTMDDLCRQDTFGLSAQQQWVANYFNTETPYNGLLLYWGTGVGKTCASISIAEKHLEYYKKYNRKVLVILGTSTMQNYIKELYNFNKERVELSQGLVPGTLQCTGNRYYIPIESTDPESMKRREGRILKKIEHDYEFITYGSLKGLISKLLIKRGLKLDLDEEKTAMPKKAPKSEGEEISTQGFLFTAVKTPKGLIWRGTPIIDPKKEERIRVALSDYFSNRLMIVDEIQNIRTAGEGGDQIAPKMLERIVHYSSDLKIVLMSATPMFNSSTEIVYILNLLLENDGREKIKVGDLFDGKDNLVDSQTLLDISRGYISYVRGANPISFPAKLLPNKSPIDAIVQNNTVYYPTPAHKMNGQTLEADDRIKYNPLVKCDMSSYQESIFRKAVIGGSVSGNSGNSGEEGEEETSMEELLSDVTNETFDINGKMISNIVYPLPSKTVFSKADVTTLFGERGFDRCFRELKSGRFEYTEDAIVAKKPIFDVDNLEKYSPKFHKILENISSTESGIIFIYSEYRKGGSLPLALMLEQNGFEQLVVEGKMGDIVVKNKLQSFMGGRKTLPQKWKYILLDGEMDPKKRAQLVQRCNSEDNRDGNVIKVVIGTRVAGEGVDFARIRQIHILNPWDNFSRIDQVVGRGIRNCSHKDLPLEDRNVTVFLYSSHISSNEIETTDEKIHRRAERKDIQMKEVEFVLRNGAVDCISNYSGNKYTVEDFGDEVGDKDDTRNCGYKNCSKVYSCVDSNRVPRDMKNSQLDKDTYDIEFHAGREIERYKKVIKAMFAKSVVFKLSHIKTYCEMKIEDFDEDVFLISLDQLIHNHEKLHDKYNRLGRIVFRDGYYLFQPNDLDKTAELPEYYRETPLTVKPSKAHVVVKDRDISPELFAKWRREVLAAIDSSDNGDELAYYLDRVKDVVMKSILLEWFNSEYSPDEMESKGNNSSKSSKSSKGSKRHERISDYLEGKDIVIRDREERPIGVQWTRELSYEYVAKSKKLVDRLNSDTLQRPMILYNFDDYNLDTHVIGRLEQTGEGREESPLKQMTCKIIDFSFVENKSNLKLDGKACMSYNKAPMNKLMENLGLDEYSTEKRDSQCKMIELALREYNREARDGKVWWIESNKLYKLEKLL